MNRGVFYRMLKFAAGGPLECAAAQAAAAQNPALGLRRSSDLREDLSIMGATATDLAALERCPRLPPIAAAGLRGYTYVILGSMLTARGRSS